MRSTFTSSNNNLIDLMSQTKQYQNHRKKIQKIMNKQLLPSSSSTNFSHLNSQKLSTIQSFRMTSIRHSLKQRQSQLQKQNDLMFQKILSVNKRRNQTLKPISGSVLYSHKNLNNLKRNIQKVNNENNLLAQKLVMTKSELRQGKLLESYQKHKQIKERLIKYQYDQDYGIVPKKIKSLEKIRYKTFRGYYNQDQINNIYDNYNQGSESQKQKQRNYYQLKDNTERVKVYQIEENQQN